MAFSPKYKINVPSVIGKNYFVNLNKKDYTGQTHEIKGGRNPIVLQRPDRNRKYDPISGQALNLSVIHDPNEAAYNIKEDFDNITNRDWLVEFYESKEGESYRAVAGISQFSIADEGTPPFALFDNLVIPSVLETNLSTDFFFTLINNTTDPAGTQDISLFVGNLEGTTSLYTVSTVSVAFGDTTEDIVDKFVAADGRLVKLAENSLRYTVSQNPTGLEALITGRSTMSITNPWLWANYSTQFIPSNFYSLDAHYLDFSFRLRLQGNTYTTLELARYTQKIQEDASAVWQDIAQQIGTVVIENVVLDDYPDELVSFLLKASTILPPSAATPTLKLEIIGISTKGNGIDIRQALQDFSTHVLVTSDDPVDSFKPVTSWPVVFANGTVGENYFTFEYGGAGGGIIEINASLGDTAESIIAKVVEGINRQNSLLQAIVDPLDATRFTVETNEDMSSGYYFFDYTSAVLPFLLSTFTALVRIEETGTTTIPFGQINIPSTTDSIRITFQARRVDVFALYSRGLSVTYRNGTTIVAEEEIDVLLTDDWQEYAFALSPSATFDNIQINVTPNPTFARVTVVQDGIAEVRSAEVRNSGGSLITISSIVASSASFNYTETSVGDTIVYDEGLDWEVVSGRELLFTGFVVPALSDTLHAQGATEFKLTATCGLADLKNATFEINDRRPFERLPLLTFLTICLQNTQLALNIYESFNLYFQTATSDRSPLVQTYEDSSRWNGASMYAVVESICKTIGATIIQRYGRWELRPVKKLSEDTISYRVFSSVGTFINEVTDSSHKKEVGQITQSPFIGARTRKLTKPAFKELEIKQDFGFVPQLLKFPNFSNINENVTETGYNSQYPWSWTNNGVPSIAYASRLQREDDGYIKIADARLQPNAFDLRQLFVLGNIDNSNPKARAYTLEIQYEANETGISSLFAESFFVTLVIHTDVRDYYVFTEDLDNPVVNPVQFDPIQIEIPSSSEEGALLQTYTQTFDFPSTALEATAELIVHQPTEDLGAIRIKSCKILLDATVESVKNTTTYYTDEDAEGVSYRDRVTSKKQTEKVVVSDVPSVNGGSQFYKNALFGFNENNQAFTTVGWTETPDAAEPVYDELVSYLRTLWIEEYAIPFFELNGTIRNISVWEEIVDKSDNDYIYMLVGGEWNVKEALTKGKWQQIALDALPEFPLIRVVEPLPTESDSSGTNSYTGASGGGAGGGVEVEVDFPVTSVNNQTGDVQLTTDNIPDSNATNKYVTAQGKTLAETGGKIIESAVNWDGTLYKINLRRERFYQLNLNDGVTTIKLGFQFGTDSNLYSRKARGILYNGNNTVAVTNLQFTGGWSWIEGSPPVEIAAGESWLLTVENISNTICMAKMERLDVVIVPETGIGIWIIEDNFVVS